MGILILEAAIYLLLAISLLDIRLSSKNHLSSMPILNWFTTYAALGIISTSLSAMMFYYETTETLTLIATLFIQSAQTMTLLGAVLKMSDSPFDIKISIEEGRIFILGATLTLFAVSMMGFFATDDGSNVDFLIYSFVIIIFNLAVFNRFRHKSKISLLILAAILIVLIFQNIPALSTSLLETLLTLFITYAILRYISLEPPLESLSHNLEE